MTQGRSARAEGYNGLRIAGNTSFLKPSDWSMSMEYEQAVTMRFKSLRIVALCSYAQAQGNDQQMPAVMHAGEA